MIKLDNDEHLLFEVRKHWIVFVLEVATLLFLAVLPAVLLYIIKLANISVIINSSSPSTAFFVIFVYTAWLFLLWITGFVFWTDYYLDSWVITTKRMVDIDQHGLFRREVSMVNLEKIQDVKSEILGIVPTLMNYGDVHVQTAGQQKEFLIHNAPNPEKIKQKLSDAIRRYKVDQINIVKNTNFRDEIENGGV